MKQNKFFILFLSLLFIPLISANGLNVTVIGNNSIEKNHGENITLEISIQNQEDFIFYNVGIEDNDYGSMDDILSISPGQTVNSTVNITSDVSFYHSFKIIGYKEASVGASNVTTNIDVSYSDGLSICQKTLIIGDTIIWNNLVSDSIQLWNANTNQEVATIAQGENYSKTFNIEEDFVYYFKRHGTVKFSDTCTLSIRSDSGMINYPEYDTSFDLNLTVNYLDTTLLINVLQREYNLDFDDDDEGVITIKNNGTQLAKVHLNGDWFEFNKNDFDISPGDTEIVNYLIDPPIYKTNDTGKTYNKSINITGNFQTISEQFSIEINYAEISSDSFNGSSIQGILAAFCLENPETIGCLDTKIIYKNIETGEYEFNVTYNEKQVNDLWDYMFAESDSQEIFEAFIKEKMDGLYENISSITIDISELSSIINSDRQEREDSEDTNNNSLLVLLFAVIISLVCFILYLAIKGKRIKNFGQVWR